MSNRQVGFSMRSAVVPAVVTLLVSLLSIAGCSGKAHSSNSSLAAPALTTEPPHSRHAPANPNAPYAVLQRRATPPAEAVDTAVPLADVPFCSPANLAVSEIAANSNAQERSVTIAFTNRGSNACQLGGYPLVSFPVDDHSDLKTLNIIHDQDASSIPTAVLQPKGSAAFSLSWTTGDDCPSVSKLFVTAPGTTQSFGLNRPFSPCQGRVQVTAIKAVPANS